MAAVLTQQRTWGQLTGERSDLVCPDCGARMRLRPSRYGYFYACTEWPACKGSHGAHPDGSPLGTPADRATKLARIQAHEALDALWKSGRMSRNHAYRWMRQALKLKKKDAHIGRFDIAGCQRLTDAIAALDRASKAEYHTITPSP